MNTIFVSFIIFGIHVILWREHTRAFSLLSHTYCVQTEFRWLLSNELNTKIDIRSYIFFKLAICSIALLSLGETCHLKGRNMVTVWRTVLLLSCYDCDSTHQHYDVTRFEYVLWCRTMHEWVMNIHYQNLNRPTLSAPPRNNGECVIMVIIHQIGWRYSSFTQFFQQAHMPRVSSPFQGKFHPWFETLCLILPLPI